LTHPPTTTILFLAAPCLAQGGARGAKSQKQTKSERPHTCAESILITTHPPSFYFYFPGLFFDCVSRCFLSKLNQKTLKSSCRKYFIYSLYKTNEKIPCHFPPQFIFVLLDVSLHRQFKKAKTNRRKTTKNQKKKTTHLCGFRFS
jgi:hypothetical protein